MLNGIENKCIYVCTVNPLSSPPDGISFSTHFWGGTRVDSSATYSFSYTYCISLYSWPTGGHRPTQSSDGLRDIGSENQVWQSVWNRDTNKTGKCFFFATVLSEKMFFPYSLFNQWKFIDSLPLCAGGDIGEINRFTKKLWNVLLLPLFQW